MVHEPLPTATSYASRGHPRRVFSTRYLLTGYFHGGNTGSNPVGDANFQRSLHFGHDRVTIEPRIQAVRNRSVSPFFPIYTTGWASAPKHLLSPNHHHLRGGNDG